MARIRVQDENREITDHQEIREFLKPFGISYENWDVEGRIGSEATNEEILDRNWFCQWRPYNNLA